MQFNLFGLLVSFGAFLSLAAAAMAFLITYTEYEKHYNEKRKVRLLAFESAALIFVLFIIISLVVAFYFNSQVPALNPG